MSEQRTAIEIPERIYLQIEIDDYFADDKFVEALGDVTWCVDQIHESDIEYVRRDVATGLYAALMWLGTQEGRRLTEHEAFELGSYLNGLTWLAEGPVPEGPLARAWRGACSREGDGD